jgi:Ca-activated chloride channel homolog
MPIQPAPERGRRLHRPPARRRGLLAALGLLALGVIAGVACSFGAAPYAMEAERHAHHAVAHTDPAFDRLAVVNGEAYADMYFRHYGVNPTIDTDEEPISTFAVDVDTASYAVTRAYLDRGHLPPEAAVRVEEFVNTFDYGYEAPGEETFALQVEAFPSPNRAGYHVLHIGLKGREVAKEARGPVDLALAIDVSGSMRMGDRMALLKRSVSTLVSALDERDTVGIVAFNHQARRVLEPTVVSEDGKRRILAAIDGLRPGGSTSVQAGVDTGYAMLAAAAREGAGARLILFSDGVANTGVTSADGIFARVEAQAKAGVPLTAIGVGMGNYNDVLLERLAARGGGSYHYIDGLREAERVFSVGAVGLLETIARDVKIQVAFDPASVVRYRLLGFENRRLETEDFEDDSVDGGAVGAGHAVTALYEVRFRDAESRPESFAEVRVRYKAPETDASRLIARQIPTAVIRASVSEASSPARLSLVAAAFAEKLRGSYWVRNLAYDDVLALFDGLSPALRDREDVRELRALLETARRLDGRPDRFADEVPVADMDFDRVPVLR